VITTLRIKRPVSLLAGAASETHVTYIPTSRSLCNRRAAISKGNGNAMLGQKTDHDGH
jgi:hypothetical protein